MWRTTGKVEFGGQCEEGASKRKCGIKPTVVVDVKEGDALLEEYGLSFFILTIC